MPSIETSRTCLPAPPRLLLPLSLEQPAATIARVVQAATAARANRLMGNALRRSLEACLKHRTRYASAPGERGANNTQSSLRLRVLRAGRGPRVCIRFLRGGWQ